MLTKVPSDNFELVTAENIKEELRLLFPDIYELLLQHAVDFKYPFIKLRYRYGDTVIDRGNLKLLYQGKAYAHNDPTLPQDIYKLLEYPHGGIPMMGVLKGTLECFVDLPSHLVPLRILKPGVIFAIYNLFYTEQKTHIVNLAYSYTAGSRSLLALTKIGHEQYNERLSRNYTIDREYLRPKTFSKHWALFRELAQAPEFNHPWEAELLVFTRPFFEALKHNEALQYRLISRLTQYNQFSQNQLMYDLIWSIFVDKLKASVKNTPFVIETVKHIIKLAMGEVPGFMPVQNNEQAPVTGLYDVFVNTYRIRYFIPVFMELNYYNKTDPVYYSLQKHTFLYHIPQRSNANRTIYELTEIRNLIYSFKEQVLENKFPISLENTVLYQTLQEVEFEFYHSKAKKPPIVTDIDRIVQEDPRFLSISRDTEATEKLSFPKNSLFFNGCIRIQPQKKSVKPSIKDMLTLGNFRLDDKD